VQERQADPKRKQFHTAVERGGDRNEEKVRQERENASALISRAGKQLVNKGGWLGSGKKGPDSFRKKKTLCCTGLNRMEKTGPTSKRGGIPKKKKEGVGRGTALQKGGEEYGHKKPVKAISFRY